MKKFLFGQMAVAMLLAVSCAKETGKESPQGSPVQVVFNVGLDQETATRAISDGTTVDRLTYLVCDGEGNAVGQKESVAMKDGSASARIQLTTGQSYTVYFWAQQGDTYGLDRFPIVDIDYGNALNNDESRDAFYAAYKIENLRSQTQNVTLTRPFAQINFGVKGEAWADVSASSLTVLKGAYSVFDLSKDAVSGPVGPVEFAGNAVPEETLYANGSDYTYLSMTYVLVDDKTPLDLSFDFGERNFTQENVAAKKNQRTNFLFGGEPTVSNGAVDEVGATEVTLTARFNNISTTNAPQEAWFAYGTDPNNLTSKKSYSGTLTSANGSFSVTLSSLSPATKYYYKACMSVWKGSGYVTIESETGQFTTEKAPESLVPSGWLELPAVTGKEDFVGYLYGGSQTDENRNYSYNYSYTYYASLWVAYPLSSDHQKGSSSTNSWSFNPAFSSNYQVDVCSRSYGTMYNNDAYSRGHQCPNGDRQSNSTMNRQTYYVTNQTPQLQNKFNGGVWNTLETEIRKLATGSEVIYIATGPVYRKVGGNENITYLTGASNAHPSRLPIANYYWKALLKVKWNGDEIKSASTIGFWFEHKEYDDSKNFEKYAVSVDQIEAWTGFDLFTNLPDSIESVAETNTSWSTFKNF